MRPTLLFILLATTLQAAGVRVLDLFPSDTLTVADTTQRTGRRVNLPCTGAACNEIRLINQFDGFSLFPRIRVRFSGPINPATLRDGIKLYTLDQVEPGREAGMTQRGDRTPINEVVYDPQTYTAYAYPDFPLDQSRRYVLIVTPAVEDTKGDPVEPDPAFKADLIVFVLVPEKFVAASTFTTMSATAFMESARRQLSQFPPQQRVAKNFSTTDIASINFNFHVRTFGQHLQSSPFPIPISWLARYGVKSLTLGSYQSPQFTKDGATIETLPTAQEVPLPTRTEEIQYNVFLPNTPMPPGGYPVVIVGHGLGSHRLEVPTAMIFGLPKAGFAIIAINALGHGYGPESTLDITDTRGVKTTLPFGGRSFDFDNNGLIDPIEGSLILSLDNPVQGRDSWRQTALDTSQLVRAIQSGIDVDSDGRVDLDPNRISYIGMSYGSFCGSLFHAIEPDVESAVLNVGGGAAVLTSRFSSLLRAALTVYVAARSPELINAPTGINENLPLRYEDVRVNDVKGAIEIQDLMAQLAWIETPGAPYAFATHFKSTTLPGVPIKRTYLQFAVGDRTVPNPSNMLLLRAANEWDHASMFRADLSGLPGNPHSFMVDPDYDPTLATAIAAQTQAADFLSGNDNPPMPKLFERPSLLLEGVNFRQ